METMDINSPSGKKSHTSNPPATMSNHVAAEARILEASPRSYLPIEQSVEGMLSDSVESLHLVPTAKLARKESTETLKLGETGNPTTAGPSAVLQPKSTRKRKRKARQKGTAATKEGGLQAESCLSEPSPPSLLGRAEEREAGDVDATGSTPVCGNESKRSEHREPGKALADGRREHCEGR
ncbi:unnamed protein product [Hermetia illucens]|uniref:Uncharacterized protein n=1 Tax=Hermetia illucens TaxID=343691 RepID=A0A7R8V5B5_HERIL|nr:unnamed protein product [Hermetia illucens]